MIKEKVLKLISLPTRYTIDYLRIDWSTYDGNSILSLFSLKNTLKISTFLIGLSIITWLYPYKGLFICIVASYMLIKKTQNVPMPFNIKPVTLTPGLIALLTFLPNTIIKITGDTLFQGYEIDEPLVKGFLLGVSGGIVIFGIGATTTLLEWVKIYNKSKESLIDISEMDSLRIVETEAIWGLTHIALKNKLEIEALQSIELGDLRNKEVIWNFTVDEIDKIKEMATKTVTSTILMAGLITNLNLSLEKNNNISQTVIDISKDYKKISLESWHKLNLDNSSVVRLTDLIPKQQLTIKNLDFIDYFKKAEIKLKTGTYGSEPSERRTLLNVLVGHQHKVKKYLFADYLYTNYPNHSCPKIIKHILSADKKGEYYYKNRSEIIISPETNKRVDKIYTALKILAYYPNTYDYSGQYRDKITDISENYLLTKANRTVTENYEFIGERSGKLYRNEKYGFKKFFDDAYNKFDEDKFEFVYQHKHLIKQLYYPYERDLSEQELILSRKEFNKLNLEERINYHFNGIESELRRHLFVLASIKDKQFSNDQSIRLISLSTEDLARRATGMYTYGRSKDSILPLFTSQLRGEDFLRDYEENYYKKYLNIHDEIQNHLEYKPERYSDFEASEIRRSHICDSDLIRSTTKILGNNAPGITIEQLKEKVIS